MTEVLTQILGGYYSAWSALRFRAAAAVLTRPIPRALATPNWVRMCAVLTQVVEADAAYWSLRFLDVSLWSVMRTADALDKQFTLIADQLASVVRKMSRAAVTRDPRVNAKIVVLRQTHTLLRIRLSALPYYRWLATDPDIATFDRTRVATQTLVSEHVGKLRHPWLSGRMTRLMVAELGALHRICTARDAMMRHQLPQAMCELHRCRSTLAAWSEQWDRDASSAPSQSEDGAERPVLMRWLSFVLATLVAKTPMLFGGSFQRQESLLVSAAGGVGAGGAREPTKAAWARLGARCGGTPTSAASEFVEWCSSRTSAKGACVALVMDAAALPRRDRDCTQGFRCARPSPAAANEEDELRGLRAYPAIFCVAARRESQTAGAAGLGLVGPATAVVGGRAGLPAEQRTRLAPEQWTVVVSLFLAMQTRLVAAAGAAAGRGGEGKDAASREVHYHHENDATYFVLSLRKAGGSRAAKSGAGRLDRSGGGDDGAHVDSSLALVIVVEGVRWSRSNRAIADFVKRMTVLLSDAQLLSRFQETCAARR